MVDGDLKQKLEIIMNLQEIAKKTANFFFLFIFLFVELLFLIIRKCFIKIKCRELPAW